MVYYCRNKWNLKNYTKRLRHFELVFIVEFFLYKTSKKLLSWMIKVLTVKKKRNCLSKFCSELMCKDAVGIY